MHLWKFTQSKDFIHFHIIDHELAVHWSFFINTGELRLYIEKEIC